MESRDESFVEKRNNIIPAGGKLGMNGKNRKDSQLKDNPLWYKDAIIYELHVRAFYDSVDDGVGDFRGLTQKLNYLQDLRITAVWLLPFCPSPMKDDGYDMPDSVLSHMKLTNREAGESARERE